MNIFFENVPYNHSDLPIYIRKANFYASIPFTTHTNWHYDIELVKVLSGEITYNVNGEVFKLSAGQGLFINANQVHYNFSSKNTDCELLCVIFQPSLLCAKKHYEEKYISPLLLSHTVPYYIFRKEKNWENEVIEHIQAIYDIARDKDFELLFHSVFFQMWNHIYKNLCDINKPDIPDTQTLDSFKTMLSFIQLHYKEKISLEAICMSGSVCKTTCNKIFKTFTGRTPVEYLTYYRLKKAIELMENNNLSLIEICYECGFSGASYFAETFKKNFGISPKKYKAKYKAALTEIFT
ncbi:MAG: AraC family transcriptional regulator [Clostridia bacterium]|nr:AraC family transcriptional regulator [Clostridia bacterium]MBR6646222.1 AraC family transcriptional regulator [Clostridia bacterium]